MKKNETDRHSNAFFPPERGQQDAILHRGKVRQQSEIVSDTSKMHLKPIYNYVLTASLNDFGPAKITIGEYKQGNIGSP